MTATETYLLLLAVVLFAALVIAIALGRFDARDADRLATKNKRLEQQLAAATAALLADLDHLTPEDFR
ncbi:hypothetical protein [Micromonospora sp. NPDC005113]